jgi:2-polyprenyl-6-methoxyphenol hydroxylase-like FAD-dependent oxidoreductase
MSMARTVDVVVAGGGVAGASAAAALGEIGFEVLVVEPGLDRTKRLAGELIHPPGVTDLATLGLRDHLPQESVVPVLGFAVVPEGDAAAYILRYGEIPGLEPHGLTIEHTDLAAGLEKALARLSHVTVWSGARLTGVDLHHPDFAAVTVTRDGRDTALRARLLVAADGASSPTRALAGIGHERVRISRMAGYLLRDVRLPHPGFASVFLGGPAPTLAYAIGNDAVRLMFDVPANAHGIEAPSRNDAYCRALPGPFRSQVRPELSSQKALVSVNYSIQPDAVCLGRLALVGDAAGCCHPLTATGLTASTRDAIHLRQALRETGDVPAAVRRYATLREGPQRTRVALAESLYRAFSEQTPEMRLLRDGILRFWQRSRRGRAASLALLSTHEGRMSMMALCYANAVGYAMTELIRRRGAPGPRASMTARGWVALRLCRATLGVFRGLCFPRVVKRMPA